MKLAIIGSRGFCDEKKAQEVFERYFCNFDDYLTDGRGVRGGYLSHCDEIVSGRAKGADLIGAEIARAWKLKLTEFKPDWEKYGKRAGFLRNEDIIKEADEVLAFWDGLSKGTANSLSIAKRLKKPTVIIYF